MGEAFIVATAFVALAELGDKTQMLSLVLASRYRARQVVAGVLAAVLALQAVAVAAGGIIGSLLPRGPLAALTVALFIAFGAWSFIDAGADEDDGEGESALARRGAASVIVLVATAFFVAELGDKTQVLTLAIAADPGAAGRALPFIGSGADSAGRGVASHLGVWLGSSTGMMLVNGVAIAAGSALGGRLPRRVVARVSGVVFIAFGVLTGVAYLLS